MEAESVLRAALIAAGEIAEDYEAPLSDDLKERAAKILKGWRERREAIAHDHQSVED